jgi:hypothetical protein
MLPKLVLSRGTHVFMDFLLTVSLIAGWLIAMTYKLQFVLVTTLNGMG